MLVIVTGLMRSGTSLLARIVHELGVPMGTEMRFPHTASAYLDWEDVEFTDKMLKAVIEPENLEEFFRSYISKRGKVFGVKSPFLMPNVYTFKAVAENMGHKVKVLTTFRPFTDTITSLRSQLTDDFAFQFSRGIQLKLFKHIKDVNYVAEEVVPLNYLLDDYDIVKDRIEYVIRDGIK